MMTSLMGRVSMHQQLLRNGIFAALLALAVTGCGEKEVVEPPPPLKPVKTMLIEDSVAGLMTFPGRVVANRRAELSFRVRGKLAKINYSEGELVKKGEIIAELDPTDYQLALENAKAEFEKAESDFLRAERLVEPGHISRRQYDRDEARYKQAGANLRQAELNLFYCKLKAPFTGVMARRNVENFQEVLAKQEIFSLRDATDLEIRIDVPERVMRVAERARPNDIRQHATFPLAGDEKYPITVKEIATRADPKTQTFEVKFQLPNPEGLNLLSGMSAEVVVDLRKMDNVERIVTLPETALDTSADKPTVWVFDPELETVLKRQVQLAHSSTSKLRVRSGLNVGDRVVIAGVSSLNEGMAVYELPYVEQAEF